MTASSRPTAQALTISLLCLLIFTVNVEAQDKSREQSAGQTDEVLRVNTELVQTNVMVFDKDGRFVENLRREQFELLVDGKPFPISFFEQVIAGSSNEERQLMTLRGESSATSTKDNETTPRIAGRTIIFFIDDLHLSLDSLNRTRLALLNFIEKEMGTDDQVAIASASGQIGFLQQFTDNKAVLRAAISRLNHIPYLVRGSSRESAPMTEYMALTIERKDDPGVFNFYVDECLKQAPPRYPRRSCEVEVINRARQILNSAASVTSNTYYSLETLMRSLAQVSRRKLVFFISDGFLLDTGPRNQSPAYRLGGITDAAVRAGVVIYTIDARGLVSGQADATNSTPMDMKGRLESASLREIPASQDALHALAADTGGTALRNSNSITGWITNTLKETAMYYVLAWRPESAEQKDGKFKRIEVSVVNRPDLKVRLPRGYLNANPQTPSPATNNVGDAGKRDVSKTPEAALSEALTDSYPKRGLPALLALSYLDTPNNGMVLTASVQVSTATLDFGTDGQHQAFVDIAGVVVNDKGKPAASFKSRLSVSPVSTEATQTDRPGVIYNYRAPLKPGIYQVRVAARAAGGSERVGSVMQWIEIPDLASRRLTMSSLLIDLQNIGAKEEKGNQATPVQVQFSVDHRFARNSHLRFLAFVYNASRGNTASDLIVQTLILRDGRVVITSPQRKVLTEGTTDPARIPLSGDIALDRLPVGSYTLQVSVTDRTVNTSASQRINFTIE